MQGVIEGFRPSPQQRRALAAGRARGGAGQGACLVASLRGAVDAGRLREALASVVEATEALRTRLVRDPRTGAPLQVIGDDAAAWAPDADWRGLAADEVARRVAAWPAAALAEPVDAAEPPVVRAALFRVGGDEHLLRLLVPAALADAASLGILLSRLAAAYAGEGDSGEEEMQLADVAEWLNEFLDGDDAAEGRRNWKQRLAAARAAHPLPTESDSSADSPAAPGLLDVAVDADLLARLDAAAESAGVPASALALAAWTALVHRLTGETEVRLAAAIDGRAFEELRGAIGPFARHLPIAVDVSAETPVAELARRLGGARAEAERWQDAFDAPSGDEPVAPLGFAWEALPAPIVSGGVTWRVREAVACAEPFRAALLCAPDGERLNARILFDPSRLSDDAAERLAEEIAVALAGAAANPQTTIGALPVIGPRERAFVLGALADGGANDAAEGETVLARILATAEMHPTREAIRWDDSVLTYGELAERFRALSIRLRAAGIGPEARAGILLDRTGDAVAAMLAVMASGGAYVPLDAAYPRERLAYMLRDSGASVLLTDAARADLADEAGCRAILVDSEDAIESIDGAGPVDSVDAIDAGAARAEGAAYVIYTSGTTGRPKGTVIEHRALARYVRAATAALELPEGARYAVVSTLAADLGATMLFPALCLGGTLHVVSERRATDPEAWAEYAARHAIDCLKVVPSHLRLLLEGAAPERALPRLRLVLGGEAAEAELVARVRRLSPALRVFNHYGPTETTVGVVAGEIGAEDGRPPLGRPLPGARIHLLDGEGNPVPAGVPGEVHVGGGTVARGYLGRPALTAERFVPDPFSAIPGARMYRTGDRARWRPDGRLEFLGRLDDQVKVNGWRVEPAEVEAALAAHPAVSVARVVPREVDGSTRLVAYVVPADGAETDADELRRHLRERLPEPFVPADVVSLARLPVTPNGKVDLRALPDPAEARASAPRAHVAPRTAEEAALVEIWASVLGREGVGVTDDFFELGGNSFLAVRLMSRIHKEFGRRLPLAALIDAGTVERVSALLHDEDVAAPGHLVEIRAGTGDLPPLFCIHPGEGTVLCYRELARHLDDGRPVFGLQALDFELERDPLVRIDEMAARYVDAITARVPEGPYLLAGWSFGGLVAFEAARQLAARGADVERVLLLDCRLPVTGPALERVDPTLFRLSLLFHGSRLVRDGSPVVTPAELEGLDVHAQLKLVAERQGIAVETLYPPHVTPDRVDAYLEIRAARTRGILEYAWGPAPVAATLFRAREVELDTAFPELADSYLRAAATPDYGWAALAEGGVEVVDVPGTHHTMFAEPHVRALARAVRARLAASAAETAAAD